MSDLLIIATFQTRLEAEIAKGLLQANGISAFITADDEGGMYPFPLQPTPKGVQLLVRNEDLQRAQQLLGKHVNKTTDATQAVRLLLYELL